MARKKLSEVIVERILSDLADRHGFRRWDATVPETQVEIQKTWEKIVRDALEEAVR